MKTIKMLKHAFIGCALLLSANAFAYDISAKNASVAFSGEHAGMEFNGIFEKWDGTIVLAPEESASILVNFDLRSAKTGDFTYDSTLPEGDWFDVENHPKGDFKSTLVEGNGDELRVEGHLTLRGKSNPVSFVFKAKGDKWHATFPIDRIAYGIGLDSDPEAEWVSRNIEMKITIPKQ